MCVYMNVWMCMAKGRERETETERERERYLKIQGMSGQISGLVILPFFPTWKKRTQSLPGLWMEAASTPALSKAATAPASKSQPWPVFVRKRVRKRVSMFVCVRVHVRVWQTLVSRLLAALEDGDVEGSLPALANERRGEGEPRWAGARDGYLHRHVDPSLSLSARVVVGVDVRYVRSVLSLSTVAPREWRVSEARDRGPFVRVMCGSGYVSISLPETAKVVTHNHVRVQHHITR